MGEEGFRWFFGIVEDRDDPKKIGRLRVEYLMFIRSLLPESLTKLMFLQIIYLGQSLSTQLLVLVFSIVAKTGSV
jgi:hypothetical protein